MNLMQMLGALEQAGLIEAVSHEQEIEYDFHHELVHATAYSTLLKSERKSLHLAVGEIIETQLSTTTGDRSALIARHFDEAGELERALTYYMQAGDAAAAQYASAEAILHYTRALEIARTSKGKGKLLRVLYLGLGRQLELIGRYREALEVYHSMQSFARSHQDQELEFSALMAHAKIYATPNPEHNPTQAKLLLKQALEFTRVTGNRADEAHVLWNLLVFTVFSGGEFEPAIQWGEAALSLAREHNLEELTAFVLNDLVYAYFGSDQTPRAQETQREAASLWRAQGNIPMLVDSLSISVAIGYFLGDFTRVLQESDEALELSLKVGNQWGQAGSIAFTGLVYYELGQIDQALEVYQRAYDLGKLTQHPAAFIASRSYMSWMLAELGASEPALELANQTYADAVSIRRWHLQDWVMIMMSQVHLYRNDLAKAQEALQSLHQVDKPSGLRWFMPVFAPLNEAEIMLAENDCSGALQKLDMLLDYLERTKTITFVPDALRLKAKAQAKLGENEEALASLLHAREIAVELGSRRSLWPVLGDLVGLSQAAGDDQKAAQYRAEAREVLEYILEHTSRIDLHRSFINRPQVRALMGA